MPVGFALSAQETFFEARGLVAPRIISSFPIFSGTMFATDVLHLRLKGVRYEACGSS